MVARLNRQSKAAASGGTLRISRVSPPPFFQGTVTYSLSRKTCIEAATPKTTACAPETPWRVLIPETAADCGQNCYQLCEESHAQYARPVTKCGDRDGPVGVAERLRSLSGPWILC